MSWQASALYLRSYYYENASANYIRLLAFQIIVDGNRSNDHCEGLTATSGLADLLRLSAEKPAR
jgi:hypothetical protein